MDQSRYSDHFYCQASLPPQCCLCHPATLTFKQIGMKAFLAFTDVSEPVSVGYFGCLSPLVTPPNESSLSAQQGHIKAEPSKSATCIWSESLKWMMWIIWVSIYFPGDFTNTQTFRPLFIHSVSRSWKTNKQIKQVCHLHGNYATNNWKACSSHSYWIHESSCLVWEQKILSFRKKLLYSVSLYLDKVSKWASAVLMPRTATALLEEYFLS